MKGERAICGNPDCGKEFIKKRYDQNCCGKSTCRVIYNRLKKGLSKYPDFMQDYKRRTKSEIIQERRMRSSMGRDYQRQQSEASSLGVSAANAVLTTAGVSLTCLLYTSPSPRDKRQSRMPSSA